MSRATACGLCGGSRLRLLLDMGEQPIAERLDSEALYPLRLMECDGCGLVQLGDRIDPGELFPPGHPYTTGTSAALRSHFRSLAALMSLYLRPGDLVADIGANDGTLLGCYDPAFRRLAVEPTGQIDKAMSLPGMIGYQEFFSTDLAEKIVRNHGQAKVITACNVLAHVPDVHDVLEGITTLLAPDGVFVTENHRLRSVLAGQWDTVYHEHARYWDIATLSRALAMHALDVTAVHDIETHGGSFRTRAVHRDDTALRHAADTAWDLVNLLAGLEVPVYGVGAATRAVPLIHYADISRFLSCVCEVSGSEKIGKNMPGTRIPIVDEKKLIEDQPPYALLLSWHMAPLLRRKLRDAGYRGRFIIPLPEPEVCDA